MSTSKNPKSLSFRTFCIISFFSSGLHLKTFSFPQGISWPEQKRYKEFASRPWTDRQVFASSSLYIWDLIFETPASACLQNTIEGPPTIPLVRISYASFFVQILPIIANLFTLFASFFLAIIWRTLAFTWITGSKKIWVRFFLHF